MSDYIDRKALIEKTRQRYCQTYCTKCNIGDYCHVCWANDMIGVIKDMPTVNAVKIVRCKDCAYSILNPRRENQRWCEAHMKMMYDDDFCSYGSSRGASNG